MSEPRTIYNNADVAEILGISPQALSNHIRRRDDTPAAAYATRSGVLFWTDAELPAWHDWRASVSIRGRRQAE